MRLRIVHGAAVSFLAVLVAVPAFGQTPPPPPAAAVAVEITPFIGFASDMSMMGGSMMSNGSSFVSPHAGTGPLFGGRAAFRVRPSLFIETALAYSRSNEMFDGDGISGHMSDASWMGNGGMRGIGALSYEADVLYELRSSRWAPYLTGGIGAFTSWPEVGGASTDPAANVGVGLKFYAQPRVALRLDLREYVGRFGQLDETRSRMMDGGTFGAHPQFTIGVGFGF